MAKSARQQVFEGMELLPEALTPFVEKRLEAGIGKDWPVQVAERYSNLRPNKKGVVVWDQAALFNVMDRFWNEAFRSVLGKAERALINELGDVRNKLSHNEAFTYDDAERALNSMRRLMDAISVGEVSVAFERKLAESTASLRKAWYSHQKEHWLGWLKEYDGPGYYGRKTWDVTAETVYNRVNNPAMVLWLGEAAGIPTAQVKRAVAVAWEAPANFSSQCGAIRRVVPWTDIEPLLLKR